MKKIFIICLGAILLTACSSPSGSSPIGRKMKQCCVHLVSIDKHDEGGSAVLTGGEVTPVFSILERNTMMMTW
jgi:hypothetical protein